MNNLKKSEVTSNVELPKVYSHLLAFILIIGDTATSSSENAKKVKAQKTQKRSCDTVDLTFINQQKDELNKQRNTILNEKEYERYAQRQATN